MNWPWPDPQRMSGHGPLVTPHPTDENWLCRARRIGAPRGECRTWNDVELASCTRCGADRPADITTERFAPIAWPGKVVNVDLPYGIEKEPEVRLDRMEMRWVDSAGGLLDKTVI